MTFDRPAFAIDDRAQRMTALRPRDVKAAPEGPDPQRAALARHLRNAINAESRRWTPRTVGLGIALAFAFVLLQIFGRLSGLSRLPLASPVLIWGGLAAVVLFSRGATRRRVGSQLAATAVAEGLCGSCCYSLRDIPPEADGCIICPECGAAWQSRRITRPHWEGTAADRVRAEGGSVGAGANWFVRFFTLTPPPSHLLAPDDRGRFVSIVDSRLLLLSPARRAELGSQLARTLRSDLRAVGRILRSLIALAPGILSLTLGAACPNSLNERNSGLTVVMGIGCALSGVLAIGLLLSHAFYSPRRAARVMVAHGRCASCARPLEGLNLEGDGCIACPECGASWRPLTV